MALAHGEIVSALPPDLAEIWRAERARATRSRKRALLDGIDGLRRAGDELTSGDDEKIATDQEAIANAISFERLTTRSGEQLRKK